MDRKESGQICHGLFSYFIDFCAAYFLEPQNSKNILPDWDIGQDVFGLHNKLELAKVKPMSFS